MGLQRNRMTRCGLTPCLRTPSVVDSCGHSNEPLSSVKGREFFDKLIDYQLLNKGHVAWNYVFMKSGNFCFSR
jgi:hypothetical protein